MNRQRYSDAGLLRLFAVVGGFIVGGLLGPAWAGDPLEMIPGDVAGVIAFRNIEAGSKKLEGFIKSLDPAFSGLDLGMIEESLDLEPGTWDPTKPIVFVLTQPSFDFLDNPEISETHAVLAFTPKHPERYRDEIETGVAEQNAPAAAKEVGSLRRVEQAGRSYYLAMRDDVVFLGGKRKAMRAMRGLAAGESLMAALSDDQKAMWADSDVFVHLPLSRWRDRISLMAMLVSNFAKLGMTTEHDADLAKIDTAVLDWSGAGVRSIIDQMQSVTFSASFDGNTFRLAHYHSFRGDGSVAGYLRQVQRGGGDLLAFLPDRPFYFLGAFDWRCPAEASVSVRLTRRIYDTPDMNEKIAPELRARLIKETTACFDQTNGSCFMVTASPGELVPIEIVGGYHMNDARQGLEQVRFIQENSFAALSSFGVGRGGKSERRTYDGHEYYDTSVDFEALSPGMRQQTAALYGEKVRFQEAAVGDHAVVYTVSSSPSLMPDVLQARELGKTARKNQLVQDIVGRLPADPNALAIVDLGRILAAVPSLASAQWLTINLAAEPSTTDAEPLPAASQGAKTSAGPMLGWAGTVRPAAFSGCLAISAKDAVRTSELAKQVGRQLFSRSKSPQSPAAGSRKDD